MKIDKFATKYEKLAESPPPAVLHTSTSMFEFIAKVAVDGVKVFGKLAADASENIGRLASAGETIGQQLEQINKQLEGINASSGKLGGLAAMAPRLLGLDTSTTTPTG